MKKIVLIALSLLMTSGFLFSPCKGNAKEIKKESAHLLNIGSVSKMYTVTAVMQLEEQGKIDLDNSVTEYIPDFKMADDRYQDITVRMLMNHTSGLMGTIYGGGFLFDEKSAKYHDEFLKLLGEQRLKYTPGQYNCYCNDGFTLLEILVERVSGMTFSDYLERYICRPLSIKNTGTQWSVPDYNNQIPCYINGDIRVQPECMQIIGAGGIMSGAEDMCSFGATFFAGNSTLLSEKAKKEMAKNYAAGSSGEGFGLGWDQVSRKDYEEKGVTVLQKSGDTNFQHANLTVAPEEEISVAVLSSGGSSSVNEELALKLLDIALDEKGIAVSHSETKKPAVVDRVPDEYQKYEGLYANANMVADISFPENRYMLLRSLTNNVAVEQQYMYTTEGEFAEVSGDVLSGNAIPKTPAELLKFDVKSDRVFVEESGSGYVLEKVSENHVSDEVLSAWEERNGESYYYYSGSYSDMYYCLAYNCFTLNTNREAAL